jgi:hypothetical protein
MSKPRIDVSETHIMVDEMLIAWGDIGLVKAYKLDLFTIDEIRVLVGFGSPEKVLELSEEQEGFGLFIRAAEVKLSFPDGWWERLAKPAFERCETTLFHRETR